MDDGVACTLIIRKRKKQKYIYEGVSQFCHSRRCFSLCAAYMIRLLKEYKQRGPPAKASSSFSYENLTESRNTYTALNRNTYYCSKYSY